MQAKELIGLDIGMKRTGMARASSMAKLAEPLMTVKTGDILAEISKLTEAKEVEAIVVGLPRSLKGDDTPQTQWVRDWVEKAKKDIDAPLYWQDEALTSKLAEARKLSSKKLHDIDSFAAAIILQDFLETPEAERVIC